MVPPKLFTATLIGLDCAIVEVEVDYRIGQTYFSVVGLADKSIQEAKDRVPAAIRSIGAEFVPMRIVVSLAPAELHKSGPSYDLPIALGYLMASMQINFDPKGKLFIGELALDGRLRPVKGILPITDSAKKLGFKEIYLPEDNADEAALIEGVDIFALSSLQDLMNHFNGNAELTPHKRNIAIHQNENIYPVDFSQIKGQMHARRALEIAAAGGHNILLSGVPGSGKTLLSRCFPSILPYMEVEESLEVTRIYSVAGKTSKAQPLITQRPFRTPHHTSSQVALVGGGAQIKPGEISLAHRGILFLDEFPEFSVQALEALRQPLEDKVVTISRASGSLTYPANFILVAAMNPCRCGYLGDSEKQCICSVQEVQKYQKKISGPILDRIDLLVNVPKVEHKTFFDESKAESSESVRNRVQEARNFQLKRFNTSNIFSNAEMNQKDIESFIHLNDEVKTILQKAVQNMQLSARSYYRLLKVSRTIADLALSEEILKEHVLEALTYRVSIGN